MKGLFRIARLRLRSFFETLDSDYDSDRDGDGECLSVNSGQASTSKIRYASCRENKYYSPKGKHIQARGKSRLKIGMPPRVWKPPPTYTLQGLYNLLWWCVLKLCNPCRVFSFCLPVSRGDALLLQAGLTPGWDM